jgi:hypothetical protein
MMMSLLVRSMAIIATTCGTAASHGSTTTPSRPPTADRAAASASGVRPGSVRCTATWWATSGVPYTSWTAGSSANVTKPSSSGAPVRKMPLIRNIRLVTSVWSPCWPIHTTLSPTSTCRLSASFCPTTIPRASPSSQVPTLTWPSIVCTAPSAAPSTPVSAAPTLPRGDVSRPPSSRRGVTVASGTVRRSSSTMAPAPVNTSSSSRSSCQPSAWTTTWPASELMPFSSSSAYWPACRLIITSTMPSPNPIPATVSRLRRLFRRRLRAASMNIGVLNRPGGTGRARAAPRARRATATPPRSPPAARPRSAPPPLGARGP